MALMALPAPGYAQQHIAGPASVTDGKSLTVAGVSVRLFGIDASEGKQTCERDGTRWACGEKAARQLRSMTADYRVECAGRGTEQAILDLGIAIIWRTSARQRAVANR